MSWLSRFRRTRDASSTREAHLPDSSNPACPGLALSRHAPPQAETWTDVPLSPLNESNSSSSSSVPMMNSDGAVDDPWNEPQYDDAAATATENAPTVAVMATPVRQRRDSVISSTSQLRLHWPTRLGDRTPEPDMDLFRTSIESSEPIHRGGSLSSVELADDEPWGDSVLDDDILITIGTASASTPESIGTTRSRLYSVDSGYASEVYNSPASVIPEPDTDMVSGVMALHGDRNLVGSHNEASLSNAEIAAPDESMSATTGETDSVSGAMRSSRWTGYPSRGRSASMGGEYFASDDQTAAHEIIAEVLVDDASADITDAMSLTNAASESADSADYTPLERYVEHIRTEIRNGPSIEVELRESNSTMAATGSTDVFAMPLQQPRPGFSFTDMAQGPLIRAIGMDGNRIIQAVATNLDERNAEVDNECPICLTKYGELNDNGVIESHVTTPCNHRFGIHCLARWTGIENQIACPLCRRDLPYDALPRPTTLRAPPTTFRPRPRAASASAPRLPDLGENRLGPPFGRTISLPMAPELTTANAEGTSSRPRRGTLASMLTRRLADITRHERSLEIAEASVRALMRQRVHVDYALDHMERQIREASARLRELGVYDIIPISENVPPTSTAAPSVPTRRQITFGSLQFDIFRNQGSHRSSSDHHDRAVRVPSMPQIFRDVFVEPSFVRQEQQSPRPRANTPAIFSPTSPTRVRDFALPSEAFQQQLSSVQMAVESLTEEANRDPVESDERPGHLLDQHRQLSVRMQLQLADLRSRSAMIRVNQNLERHLNLQRRRYVLDGQSAAEEDYQQRADALDQMIRDQERRARALRAESERLEVESGPLRDEFGDVVEGGGDDEEVRIMEMEAAEIVEATQSSHVERRNAITSEAEGHGTDENCDVIGCCVNE